MAGAAARPLGRRGRPLRAPATPRDPAPGAGAGARQAALAAVRPRAGVLELVLERGAAGELVRPRTRGERARAADPAAVAEPVGERRCERVARAVGVAHRPGQRRRLPGATAAV